MNAYLISLFAVGGTSALGSYFTSKTVNSPWYTCIKPDITPPSYVFPIVWTTLYILFFFVFVLSLQKHFCISLFSLSLFLNVLWCYLYFDRKQIEEAFVVLLTMVFLGVSILWIAFHKKEYRILTLFTPYVLWISFASYLNYESIGKKENC